MVSHVDWCARVVQLDHHCCRSSGITRPHGTNQGTAPVITQPDYPVQVLVDDGLLPGASLLSLLPWGPYGAMSPPVSSGTGGLLGVLVDGGGLVVCMSYRPFGIQTAIVRGRVWVYRSVYAVPTAKHTQTAIVGW